jgi:RNA recognition motif-containing protein
MGSLFGALSAVWRKFFPARELSEAELGAAGRGRLYVGNLNYNAKEEDLRSLFEKYGKVYGIHMIRDRITRRLKGYAFVEMPGADAVKALILNGSEFFGRKIVVSQAKAKAPNVRRSKPRKNWRQKRSGEARPFFKDKPTTNRYE